MDEYEMTGSLDETAGGAASLGPDAAGYAPTAAATPTPMSAAEAAKYDKIPVGLYPESPAAMPSPVDSLAPQAMEQMKTALSLGASELSPANRQRWMPSNAQLAAFGLSPVSPSRNLTDGVFTRPVSPVANPAMPNASDSLARLRDSMLAAAYGRSVTREFLDALPEERKFKAMDRLVEALRKPTPGVKENLLDKWRNDDPNRFRGPYRQPSPDFRQKRENQPEYLQRAGLPEFTLLRGSDGRERNGYDYNGVRVELPAGFDTSDPAKTAAQVSFSNQVADWMNNDDDEMEV